MIRRRNSSNLSFIDLLFNLALVFTALFLLTFILINPVKKGDITPIAEFIITMRWDDNSLNDIDIYIQDPSNNILYFRNKDTGLMHLDRDDRGHWNDTVSINGELITIKTNVETVSIRGVIAGTWRINVQFYRANTNVKEPVVVEMIQLNPYKLIFSKEVILDKESDEGTVYSFKMNDNKLIEHFDDTFKSLAKEVPNIYSGNGAYTGTHNQP